MNSLIYSGERIWKGWKKFTQYKIRTLKEHDSPNSEIIPWRKFIRKYWIDEIPQIVNLLLGEIGIFWVRPHRERQLQKKKKHIQEMYIANKPWFIGAHAISQYLWEEYNTWKHDEMFMRLQSRKAKESIAKRVEFHCFLVYQTALQVLAWHENVEK